MIPAQYIILESKYLIFRSTLGKTFPTIGLLVSKCKTTHQIERFIVMKNKKLHFHNKKWHHFLPIMEHELSPPTPNLNYYCSIVLCWSMYGAYSLNV